ncbi:DUF3892 domain-containing protein [Acidovorax sp.]|jgi:hypothetical protein|uniref:DUF3892 domain-containing protein n=1 Tax=Acidovorax sp. TaxID=1872122 RepID=UPI00391F516B
MSLALSVEISFIKKNPRYDPFHPILYVGGSLPAIWHQDMRTAAQMQWDRTVQFYVQSGLRRVNVVAEYGPSGLLHLRTEPDGTLTNNLLSLPEFPFFYDLILGGTPAPQETLQSPRGLPGLGLIGGALKDRAFGPINR